MELLEKLDILNSKIDDLLNELELEKGKSSRLEIENLELKEENKKLTEQKEAVRERVEKLINKL